MRRPRHVTLRIVNKDPERLAAVDSLQTSRDVIHRLQPLHDLHELNPVGETDRGRHEAVPDMTGADHRRADRHDFAARRQEEELPSDAGAPRPLP